MIVARASTPRLVRANASIAHKGSNVEDAGETLYHAARASTPTVLPSARHARRDTAATRRMAKCPARQAGTRWEALSTAGNAPRDRSVARHIWTPNPVRLGHMPWLPRPPARPALRGISALTRPEPPSLALRGRSPAWATAPVKTARPALHAQLPERLLPSSAPQGPTASVGRPPAPVALLATPVPMLRRTSVSPAPKDPTASAIRPPARSAPLASTA